MQEPVLSNYLGYFIKYFQGIFFFQKKKQKTFYDLSIDLPTIQPN